MPLSDREQQILQDIEARLRADDPKFAKTVSTASVSRDARRRVKLSIAGFIVGFALLLSVVPAQSIWLGIAGFAVMLAAVVYGGNQLKRLGQDTTDDLGGQLRGGFTRYLGDRRHPDETEER
ncbi:MAG: DUF3040 domain-containing protein [Euzebyales bacterium]|jgi:hypothetical protein|nr:DUF3040 domain-containing protein [Euzebyales bacterium]